MLDLVTPYRGHWRKASLALALVLAITFLACKNGDPPPVAPTENITVPPAPKASASAERWGSAPVEPPPAEPFVSRSEPNDDVQPDLAPTPTGPPGMAPFDRGAAARALGQVNVTTCRQGVTGSGHVTITFSPDGRVSSAVVDAGPFPGTTTGSCIANRFRGARVPPFAGAEVRVGKSFTLN